MTPKWLSDLESLERAVTERAARIPEHSKLEGCIETSQDFREAIAAAIRGETK